MKKSITSLWVKITMPARIVKRILFKQYVRQDKNQKNFVIRKNRARVVVLSPASENIGVKDLMEDVRKSLQAK